MFPRRRLASHAGALLVALVLAGVAGWLGYWQYDAWAQRRDAEARDLTRIDPMPLDDVLGPDDPFPGDKVGHPVTVAGTWVPDATLYVSDRERDGQDGLWVVTPLAVDGDSGAALLVVRGWARSVASAPPAPRGRAELVAWLQPGEGTGAEDDDPDDDVLPQLRVADALRHVDQDLYGAYAVAADPSPGLEPASLDQLPTPPRFTALRNLLYAFEWWFFGLFVVFIWWRWVRDEAESEVGAPSG